MALSKLRDELICMFKETHGSAEIMTNRSATLHARSHDRPICLCETTLVFFLVATRPRTFVRVARIAVRGWRVLIFRGCDHLSDTTTLRSSDIPCRQADTARVTMRFRWIIYAACVHYNSRGILKRRAASVSLIYARAGIRGGRRDRVLPVDRV